MARIACSVVVSFMLAVSARISHASATPAQKCAVAKNKAAAKRIDAELKCWRKAFAISDAAGPDVSCLVAAETKFNTAVGKAEAKGGCTVMGDGVAIGIAANNCAATIAADTRPTCANGGIHCGSACGGPTCAGTCFGPANNQDDCSDEHCGAVFSTPGVCEQNATGVPTACNSDADCPSPTSICITTNFQCGPAGQKFCAIPCPE